jgi:hypothetical protein
MYVKILCRNGWTPKAKPCTAATILSALLVRCVSGSGTLPPSRASIRTDSHVLGGPAATFRSGSSTARVRVASNEMFYLRVCVSVCRVMKPVGEGFRAWSSNPLLLLASLMGASVQACRLLAADAEPVQSTPVRCFET